MATDQSNPAAGQAPTGSAASPPSTDMIFKLFIGASIVLLAGVLAVFFGSDFYKGDSALWFVGFVLIALAALAMTAAVFRGLGYATNPGEAFGLPSGSIRAVLAIAIMVLLMIFGLPLVTPDRGPHALVPLAPPVKLSCAELTAEVTRYKAAGLMVVVDNANCTTGRDASPATVILFANKHLQPDKEELEVSKQLLTAIATLLTTIIGFYFGSQNALSLVTAVGRAATAATAAGAAASKVMPDPKMPKDEAGANPADDSDAAADGCPSDSAPQAGEAATADDDLPPAEGGVAPAASPTTPPETPR